MTLRDFFITFKHEDKQIENLLVYFSVYKNAENVARIDSGYSVDFGYSKDGIFHPSKKMVNNLDDEIDTISVDVLPATDTEMQVTFDIVLK